NLTACVTSSRPILTTSVSAYIRRCCTAGNACFIAMQIVYICRNKLQHMKSITALFAAALLAVTALTSCTPGELPDPADPGNPGTQQPGPQQPDTLAVQHEIYECVTGEYIIDTAAIGGG